MSSPASVLQSSGDLSVIARPYGTHQSGAAITEFALRNAAKGGIEVRVINYGAIITAVMQPDREGKRENVVIGYDHLEVGAMRCISRSIGRRSWRSTAAAGR